MALEFVSAEWVVFDVPGAIPVIKAIGNDGSEYWLPGSHPLTYDVPPWPQFIKSAAGKAFLETTRPEPPPPDPSEDEWGEDE